MSAWVRTFCTESIPNILFRMCREILNTCVRNTEEAEKASHTPDAGANGRGQGRGLWVMIEESELAKTFRQDEQKKVEAPGPGVPSSLPPQEAPTDLTSVEQKDTDGALQSARSIKAQLEGYIANSTSDSGTALDAGPDHAMVNAAKDILKTLIRVIEFTDDPSHLEELLALNDEITGLLARATPQRPKLSGLGIRIENGHSVSGENGVSLGEGLHEHAPEEEEPVTPRIDKGKGRAEPEPEPLEPVLSPTKLAMDSDDEEIEVPESLLGQVESIVSPTDRYYSLLLLASQMVDCYVHRSRSWVAEEGEVFRKGAVLLTQEEMETEYDSEELRKEVCCPRLPSAYRVTK